MGDPSLLPAKMNGTNDDVPVDEFQHGKMLDSIRNIGRDKRKVVTARSEPAITNVSEFAITSKETVSIDELLGSCAKSASVPRIGYKTHEFLDKMQNEIDVVQVPLDKPLANKISRKVAYEKTCKEISKWEKIVVQNRTAEQMTFPLNLPEICMQTNPQKVKQYKSMTKFEKDVRALLQQTTPIVVERTSDTKEAVTRQTLEEVYEMRRELRKIRARQSFYMVKARYQKKIKSKQYRRILRKDRARKELKTFEVLQKTNPASLLKKLDKLDEERVLERMTLRHHNTGKWARGQILKTKNDKDIRSSLNEQLELGRTLKARNRTLNYDSDEEENSDNKDTHSEWKPRDSSNPWMSANCEHNTYTDGRQKNTNGNDDQLLQSYQQLLKKNDANSNVQNPVGRKTVDKKQSPNRTNVRKSKRFKSIDKATKESDSSSQTVIQEIQHHAEKETTLNEPTTNLPFVCHSESARNVSSDSVVHVVLPSIRRIHKKPIQVSTCGNLSEKKTLKSGEVNIKSHKSTSQRRGDISNEVPTGLSKCQTKKLKVDTVVYDDGTEVLEKQDEFENLYQEAVQMNKGCPENKQSQEVKRDPNEKTKKTNPSKSDILKALIALRRATNISGNDIKKFSKIEPEQKVEVNPTNFITVKAKKLRFTVPREMEYDDDMAALERDNHMTIAEAFEDDDVLDEFREEKKVQVEEDKPKDLDFTLPGWGTWGGKNITVPKWIRRRFIVKAPKGEPRKDRELGHVIINENAMDGLKPYMVPAVPFQFRSEDEFVSSISNPVGKNWNPESAFRILVKPKVITRMGTIINPMDEDYLKDKEESEKE